METAVVSSVIVASIGGRAGGNVVVVVTMVLQGCLFLIFVFEFEPKVDSTQSTFTTQKISKNHVGLHKKLYVATTSLIHSIQAINTQIISSINTATTAL